MAGRAECQVSNTVAAVFLRASGGIVLGSRDGGDPGRRQADCEYHTHDPQRTQQHTQN